MSTLLRYAVCFVIGAGLLVPACKKKGSQVDLKVVAGREDSNILPTSVGLAPLLDNVDWLDPVCTGAFVNDHLLITAAHCVIQWRQDPNIASIRIVSDTQTFKNRTVHSSQYLLHPEYAARNPELKSSDLPSLVAYDIGFIIFPPNTAPPSLIIRFASTPPVVGELVQLVGYGVNAATDFPITDGTRRYGRNRIETIDSQHFDAITVRGVNDSNGATAQMEKASIGQGDSGGPLYNEKGEVIGITSYRLWTYPSVGKAPTPENNYTISGFANILNPVTRAYIDEVMRTH